MRQKKGLICEKTKWEGRESYRLANDLVRLVTLTGGGHIAQFRFQDSTGLPTLNPLWKPPWKSMEPYRYRQDKHSSLYGPLREGKLLSGIKGHNLCLDYFGPPSDEEAAQGLSFHGEAPNLLWKKTDRRIGRRSVALELSVSLPVAELYFSREIKLQSGEPVVYFKETVTNRRKADHFFHWTQHVTLGPPFLSPRECYIVLPGTKGKTDPHGYDEGKNLLGVNREFRWPYAPKAGAGRVDLSRPLSSPGRGFVATVLLDPGREFEFICAVNTRHNLLAAYCFSRRDFPWVAIWEENRAIAGPPWKRKTQSRGLEFGATPLPIPRREAFALGSLFGAPSLAFVPARGQKTVRYLAFLSHIPRDFGKVRDIRIGENEIIVQASDRKHRLRVPAAGLARNLGLAGLT